MIRFGGNFICDFIKRLDITLQIEVFNTATLLLQLIIQSHLDILFNTHSHNLLRSISFQSFSL